MHLVEEASLVPPRMTGVAGTLQKAERLLGSAVAAMAALLVVAEIIVLFTGVSARYFFQKPLIWSDELAGILFLWLAMFGAVVAFLPQVLCLFLFRWLPMAVKERGLADERDPDVAPARRARPGAAGAA